MPLKQKKQPPTYTKEQLTISRALMGAKQRCENKNTAQYKDYGERGICFLFASIREGTMWVLDNIGPRPTDVHTLDRIDNNRGYEPGNLRWATRSEQGRNKRMYRGYKYGDRLRNLVKLRGDYSYEGLRKYVNLGYTDEEILAMPKPAGGRKAK